MKLALYLILFPLYFAHDFNMSFRFARNFHKTEDFLGKNAPSDTQRFFGLATVLVMGYYVLALVFLATGFSFWGLITEIVVLNTPFVQTIGFSIGILSLLLMTLARLNLRSSWRVGLDYATTDALVTDGFYRYIRNPYFAFLLAFQFSLMLVSPRPLHCAHSCKARCCSDSRPGRRNNSCRKSTARSMRPIVLRRDDSSPAFQSQGKELGHARFQIQTDITERL
ncbi:MAG: hypothetical protein M1485_06795 [Chloroflexi bacterium]|nr:hypothetical protein [Chloroflexota bacterium]